jgi:hypothetical protein
MAVARICSGGIWIRGGDDPRARWEGKEKKRSFGWGWLDLSGGFIG